MSNDAPLSPGQVWVRLLLYPGHTLPTAAAPVLVGSGLAFHDGIFAFWPALLAFLGSWSIHLGGVFADNLELLTRHASIEEHPELSRAVGSGALRLTRLRRLTAACFVLGAALGAHLAWRGGPWVLLIGAIGVLASVAYASAGIRYARLGLADPVFFLMFGFVAVAATYSIQAVWRSGGAWSHRLVPEVPALAALLAAGLPVGALVTNVLVIDDMRDLAFDALKGWRTTAVRHGLAGSRRQYALLSILAYLAPFVLWLGLGFSSWVLLPLLSLPLAIRIGRVVMTRSAPAELLPMTPRASRLALLYALLSATGIAA